MQLTADGLITLERSAQLKPYTPRPSIEREYLTDAELLANVGSTMFVNVESYPNYFLITFKLHKQNKFLQLECGEGWSFNPQFLSWVMHNYKTVGFNSLNYDILMIWLAFNWQDAATLKDATNDLITKPPQVPLRPQELKNKYNFRTHKTSHIDLIEIAPLTGSLKLYGARLHTKSIQEQPFDINADLREYEIEELRKFNCNQACITEELFDFMKERLELREAMSLEYREDLMSKSDAQIAEAVLSKEVGKLNGKRIERPDIPAGTVYKYNAPEFLQYATKPMQELLERVKNARFVLGDNGKIIPPTELKIPVDIGGGSYSVGIGGLHSIDKCKSYEAKDGKRLKDIDVTSYYPNAIMNMSLYPIAMGPNFLSVYGKFKTDRVAAKRNKQFTKDKGLKIFLNGVSGKFSDVWSKMYSPGNTIQMNLTGQLSILMLAEMFECNGVEVVSANTDGLVVYYDNDEEEKVRYWIKFWESLTDFQLEDADYIRYHARDVNAYFAVKLNFFIRGIDKKFSTRHEAQKYAAEKSLIDYEVYSENGDVKIKGPWSEVGSQSGTQLDTNPVVLVCTDAVVALLSKGAPIEETILECKDFTRFVAIRQAKAPGAHWKGEYLGKVVRFAYMKGETGCIQTVAHNNKVAGTEGARPFMDMPDSFPEDIDYIWYINKTKEILEDIGHTKKPKQLQFF